MSDTTSKPKRKLDPATPTTAAAKAPSYRDLYERHLPAAMALPDDQVQPCTGSVEYALVNVRLGVKSTLSDPAQIALVKKHLPLIPIDEVLSLPDVARALFFAHGKVVTRPASPREIEEKLRAISGPREQMLTQAELLAQRGKLDKDLVAKIRSGNGKYDTARDGVDLVALYRDNANEIRGLHPFTDEEMDQLQTDSEWLLENLSPGGARQEKRKKSSPEQVRDRLWTLVVTRHEHLRKIGYYFHGDAFDAYTPKLTSRIPSSSAGGGEAPVDDAEAHAAEEPAAKEPATKKDGEEEPVPPTERNR